MPIANPNKTYTKPQPVITRDSAIAPARQIAVDTKYEPKRSLLVHVTGARWVVTYYKQLLTSEEAGEPFNLNRPAPYQQYIKINNFEFRVQSALQHSPQNENSSSVVTGTSVIHPSIVPTPGDTFVADIGDGRAAYFNITEVTQLSISRDTTYEIEYQLTDYVTPTILERLEQCVVKESVYERSFADFGANPVLEIDEYRIYGEIQEWEERIRRYYFDKFFNHEFHTFLVPAPGIELYDPFINEFISRIWSVDQLPELRHAKIYPRDTSSGIFIRTIWDAILEMDPYSLGNLKKNLYIVPRRFLRTGLASFGSMAYSRIPYIYYPGEEQGRMGDVVKVENIGELSVKEVFSTSSTVRELKLNITKLPGLGFVHESLKQKLPIPDAKRFGSFDTYVVSDAFYLKDRANMSKIERYLMDALENLPLEAKDLLPILKDVINWGDLEQFYYIPLLTALARCSLGDLSQ